MIIMKTYNNKLSCLLLYLIVNHNLFIVNCRFGSSKVSVEGGEVEESNNDVNERLNSDDDCGIYLAKSMLDPTKYALYVTKEYSGKEAQTLTDQELVVPIINANKNEYSPWHDFVWNQDMIPSEIRTIKYNSITFQQTESRILTREYFIAGIAAIAPCTSKPYSNVRPNYNKLFYGSQFYSSDNNNEDYINHDSVSDYHNFLIESTTAGTNKETTNQLQPGSMIINECRYDPNVPENTEELTYSGNVDSLRTDGVCVDTIQILPSTIPGIGRGAFAKFYASPGDVVATSPVIHLDRSQMQIVEQSMTVNHTIPLHRLHGIEYTSTIIGQQLLLNYCYGHPQSNVLLLPYGPGVNFINHPSSDDEANVRIRWSTKFRDTTTYRTTTPIMELYEQSATGTHLMIEFVAIRDIGPGEEIFLHYGLEFQQAWEDYIVASKSSSTEQQQQQPFRHEIGVPLDGFYVDRWMRTDPKPYGDFIASRLSAGHMAPIRWQGTAEVVTPWAFRIGLPSQVRNVLLDYCNQMGITDILRHVTMDGNGLLPGTETHMTLEGDDWYLQRPDVVWRSNLHWFSPGASPAHEHYLQALSAAGFDTVLEGIGNYLGMDGLVAFHVTFIAASFSNRGFLHYDVRNTGAKVYNIIIPLLLANETGPELDVQSWKPDLPEYQPMFVGRYRYEYDVASMLGDSATHATSACDYRYNKEMRMAATVYVADVNELNAENILKHYTQAYPPRDLELIKSWIGRHWKRDDPSRKLPKPSFDHILVRNRKNNSNNNNNIRNNKWIVGVGSRGNVLSSSQKMESTVVVENSDDTPSEEL